MACLVMRVLLGFRLFFKMNSGESWSSLSRSRVHLSRPRENEWLQVEVGALISFELFCGVSIGMRVVF